MKKDIELAFNKIEQSYDIKVLFSYALYHKFDNVERIYLDEFNVEGIELFLFLINYLYELMKSNFTDSIYICLVNFSNKKLFNLPKKKKESMKYLNINISNDKIQKTYFLEDDEWYVNLFFYKEEFKNIKKYLWGILSKNFLGIEPVLNMELFFISNDLSKLINIYDDRGVDIMKLEID